MGEGKRGQTEREWDGDRRRGSGRRVEREEGRGREREKGERESGKEEKLRREKGGRMRS